MNATNFIICCRRLVGALREQPRPAGHATFFLGFDAEGLPFYKAGSFNAGQLTSTFTEPLFFCPFCGRRIRDGAGNNAADARPRVRTAEEDGAEELTRPAAARDEQETVIAARRAYGSFPPAAHLSDFTSAGRANSESGTGALNSTFS